MEALSHYENVAQLRVDDPSGKVDVSLGERANRVNAWGSNLHISVHGNAATPAANGIETFVHPSAGTRNREVALTIHNHIIQATNRRNRGLKEADFQILRDTKMDALLIEGGFMTNREELALMKTSEYRAKVGRAIVAGIVEKYGLTRKVETTMENQAGPYKHSFFFTGGYAGQELTRIHEFLLKNGFGYQPLRSGEGYLMFDVGGFAAGSEAEKKMENFLKENKFAYQKRIV